MKKMLAAVLLVTGLLIAGGQYPPAHATTATVSSEILYGGSTTIPENPSLNDAGYPTSGYTTIKFNISPAVPDDSGSKFVISTSSQCFLSFNAKGGGIYGQRFEEPSSYYPSGMSSVRVTVAGVDDSKYEGTHSCKVTGWIESPDADFNGASASKTFTLTDNESKPKSSTPSTTTKPSTSTPSTSSTAPAPDVNVEDDKPSAPKLERAANGETQLDASKQFEVKSGESIVFSGTTIPNGEVTLTIYSNPLSFTTTADKDGYYEVEATGIPEGDHEAEILVTDPETNLTSDPATIAKFSVVPAAQASGAIANEIPLLDPSAESNSNLPWLLGAGAVGVIGLGVVGYLNRARIKHILFH